MTRRKQNSPEPTLPKITYLIDPRFPGGTSSAVAAELEVMTKIAQVEICAIETRMFRDAPPSPLLAATIEALGLKTVTNPQTVSGDLVILHNPAMLKFDDSLPMTVLARHLVVVCHENFYRAGSQEGFDIAHCLGLLSQNSLALRKSLAPISALNRRGIARWAKDSSSEWDILEPDWFNICQFPIIAPSAHPRDRRGRVSRSGFEKFPSVGDLDLCFPKEAEANVILGSDSLTPLGAERPHWTLLPFRSKEVAAVFEMIDFMVYFTSPNWSESFGRVIAEAIAAGKLVLCDDRIALNFSDAVIACKPAEVSDKIARYCADPKAYARDVRKAQAQLEAFSPQAFQDMAQPILSGAMQ